MPKPQGIDIEKLTKEISEIVSLSTVEERRDFKTLLVREVGSHLSKEEWKDKLGQIFSVKLMEKLMKFSMIDTFMDYLKSGEYYLESFGEVEDAAVVLSFSYGESEGVNKRLARTIDKVGVSLEKKYVQWEVAELLNFQDGVNVISLKPGEKYMTTRDVVVRFVGMIGEKRKVLLVAQSWHAPRCIFWCNKLGFEVVGGKFVDEFVPVDPQLWVRDVLSWFLKESITVKMDRNIA